MTVKPVSIFTLSHVIFPCLGDFNVPSEDCYRISKEIENLRSQLALKKKELKCYQQNKKLRVELDLKVKEVECLRKENEELKAQNKDLQKNVCFQLSSYLLVSQMHLCMYRNKRFFFCRTSFCYIQYFACKLKQQICSLSMF